MTTPNAPSLANTMAVPAFRPPPGATRPKRLDSVDILRGLIMIVMMLDHTRDFVAASSFQNFDPMDVTRTTAALFLTRWITHFCAPLFVFLAGTSAYLQKMRGKPIGVLSGFLLKRGFWLIVLEFTVLKLAMWFNLNFAFLATLQVIWAIGVSMIVLAGLVRFPVWVSGVFGAAMIALHNLLDGIRVTVPNGAAPTFTDKLWMLLHQGGFMPLFGSSGPIVWALYPLIPWIGVMAAGYAFGKVFELDPEKRRRLLVQIGGGCVAAFIIIRLSNIYGDPFKWSSQASAIKTVGSFLAVQKYPPSLLFLLMTLGPGILALSAFDRWRPGSRIREVLLVYGRVPLFFYLLQWVTAHGIAVLLSLAARKPIDLYFMNPLDIYAVPRPQAGFPLWVVWLSWIAGVALLYPLCRWYGGVKARRKDWWLSYL